MTTGIKLPQGWVVIRRDKEEARTAAGGDPPRAARPRSQQGEVLAVGPDRMREDGSRWGRSVQSGDRVLFAKHAGVDVKVGRDEVLLIREDEILGVIKN